MEDDAGGSERGNKGRVQTGQQDIDPNATGWQGTQIHVQTAMHLMDIKKNDPLRAETPTAGYIAGQRESGDSDRKQDNDGKIA